jgi:hypothetical protein
MNDERERLKTTGALVLGGAALGAITGPVLSRGTPSDPASPPGAD